MKHKQLAAQKQSCLETIVVRTPGYVSALESHGLMNTLRAKGIKALILGGLSTSGCVLSTARAGADRGFIMTVVSCPSSHNLYIDQSFLCQTYPFLVVNHF